MNRYTTLIVNIGLALLLAVSSSPAQEFDRSAAPGAKDAEFASDTRDDVPAGPRDIRTTSAAVYVGNLDARIESLKNAAAAKEAPQVDLMLAETLAHRARLLGRPEDREAAMAALDALLEREPAHGNGLILRARLLSARHDFDAALDALDKAAEAGAPEARVERHRAEVLVALGRVDEAKRLAAPHLSENLADLAFRANRQVDEGRLKAADELFIRAQAAYGDSNPYPLAWLHVQHGVLFLRSGDAERARGFFAAAHERLPAYYLAAEHRAEAHALLGEHERAARLYRQVSEQTGNPVFFAALADAERALGNSQASAEADKQAREGFEAWLDRRPRTAWQHAAEYFLDRGEVGRSVDLARKNADLRQDVGSLLLLARAEQAAGHLEEACKAWRRARATGLNPPEFAALRERFDDC